MKLNKIPKSLYLGLIIGVIVVGFVIFIMERKLPAEEESPLPSIENAPEILEWKIYQDKENGFEIKYPKDSRVIKTTEGVYIYLPFSPGTTLVEKYLKIILKKTTPEKCSNPAQTIIEKTEIVYINGIKFKKEIGKEHAAGHIYKSVSYSTVKGDKCLGLIFILRSLNPEAFDIPPPLYDERKESEIFEKIISTFQFSMESTKNKLPAQNNTLVNTSNWKTYRNEKYYFQINYPKDLIIKEINDSIIVFYPQNYNSFQAKKVYESYRILVEVKPNETLETWIRKLYKVNPKEISNEPISTPLGKVTVRKINIREDLEGYQIHCWAQAIGECHYYFKHNDLILDISRSKVGLNYSDCSKDLIFNRMLSTLRFIK